MKKYLLLLLLACSAMAVNSDDQLHVYVVDQDGRSLQGAHAVLMCHYENYGEDQTKIRELDQTDEDGMADIPGPIELEACSLGKPIAVNVTYFGESVSVSGNWRKGINTLTAVMPGLYDVRITVIDQHGDPIEAVEVKATPAQGGEGKTFGGKTDGGGTLVFSQIPAGTRLLTYMANGDEAQSSVATIGNGDTAFAASMHAYALTITVIDGRGTAIDGAGVKVEGGGYFATSETDGTGSASFEDLRPWSYTYTVTFQGRLYHDEVKLSEDSTRNVVVGASKSGPPSTTATKTTMTANATNNSPKWFRYLMGELDGLILEQKQKAPRMRLVFVPIGYSQNDSGEFKALAQASVDRFLEVSPLGECDNPSKEIETYFIEPSVCNISGCINACGDCQTRIKNCSRAISNPYRDRYDMIIGLCKNTSCGGSCGGCAGGIPSRNIVSNSAECAGTPADRIVTHEMGHGLGLYHVKSTYGLNGCWDDEEGACGGPNKADCNASADDISRMVMAYCPTMEDYGSAGYSYLRDNQLKNYIEVCK